MLAQVLDTLKTHIDTVYLQTDYSKLLERIVQNKSTGSLETFNIIINVIIAIFAFLATYISIKALKQSKEFKEAENLSRRAWILPNDHPGYYDVNIDKEYVRYIELKNF